MPKPQKLPTIGDPSRFTHEDFVPENYESTVEPMDTSDTSADTNLQEGTSNQPTRGTHARRRQAYFEQTSRVPKIVLLFDHGNENREELNRCRSFVELLRTLPEDQRLEVVTNNFGMFDSYSDGRYFV